MARIRTIKPEFWSSPAHEGANPWVMLLFQAMWNWADDHGRGTANPHELKGFAFPHDGMPAAAELPLLLQEVQDRYEVEFYRVAGRPYYYIPSWGKHQKVEKKALPRHPGPNDGTPYSPTDPDQGKRRKTQGRRGAVAETPGGLQETRGASGLGTGEQGNRGTGEVRRSPSSLAALATTEPAAAPARRDDEPVTIPANKIVAAWIDAAMENGVSPTPRTKGMVAKEIGQVLAAGNDSFRVLEAAKQSGAKGYPNVERELLTMQGRIIPSRQQPMGAADRAFATRAQVLEELRRDA